MPTIKKVVCQTILIFTLSFITSMVMANGASGNARTKQLKSPTSKVKSSGLVMVKGMVVNDDGKPVYGIRGYAMLLGADGKTVAIGNGTGVDSSGRRIRTEWKSGNGGKFIIRLMPGTYEVYAEAAWRYAFNLVVPEDKSSISIKVRSGLPGFTKLRVPVHGTVVSIDGKPLPNVKGICQNLSYDVLRSDWVSVKDGSFVLRLRPGKYRIWSQAAEAKAVEFVVREDDSKAQVKVISSPHNGLLLKFESPEGKALSNTIISYGVAGGRASITTDVNGFYTFRSYGNVPLHLFFVLKGVGYADLNINSEETLFGDKPVVVRLNSGVFVSGRIVSGQDNIPLGGVPIFPVRKHFKGDQWSWWNAQFGFKSVELTMKEPSMAISRDGDGTFTLGPLPPGDYSLIAGLPGISYLFPSTDLIETESKDVSLASGKNLDGLEIRVPVKKPAYSLQGRVFKSDGTPLASTEITMEVSGDYTPGMEPEEWYVWEPVVRTVVTDAQGYYKLFTIRPSRPHEYAGDGTYKLVAKWNKLSATRTVFIRADTKDVDFTLH